MFFYPTRIITGLTLHVAFFWQTCEKFNFLKRESPIRAKNTVVMLRYIFIYMLWIPAEPDDQNRTPAFSLFHFLFPSLTQPIHLLCCSYSTTTTAVLTAGGMLKFHFFYMVDLKLALLCYTITYTLTTTLLHSTTKRRDHVDYNDRKMIWWL